ncbi:MAG: efflux RND transporter periplasmic adaptor subunit [Candidatus Scalindua sp.]|nr:efflux RND transporter periplasmic adaptor subunit [Candidatus Scalindua sp.]
MIINPSAEFSLPVILFSIIFLSGCGTDIEPLTETTPRVKYFEVGEQATGQSRRISGKLIPADTSVLSFSVSGTIEQVLVSRGDTVLQGQVLAVLDIEPLRLAVEQARAQLNIARSKVTETKQIYDRTVTLFHKRASSQAEVDTATANHAAARGNLKAAQSDLDRKQRNLSHAELTAPFAGTIAERNIDPFQETTVGQSAFLLQSSDALEVDVRIPETMIRDIDYGQRVQVTFPTIQGKSLTGVVSEIGSRVGAGNAFPVKIQLSASQTKLLPGMTASITFNFNEYLEGRTVYLIPLAAIAIEFSMLRQAKGSSSQVSQKTAPVFVVDDNHRLQVRDVVIGDLRGNQLEVYEGLEAGEKIVSAGVTFLHENMTVELWTPEQGLTDG